MIKMRFREFQSDWKAEQRENGNKTKLTIQLESFDMMHDAVDEITIDEWKYDNVLRILTCHIVGGGKLEIPIRRIAYTIGVDP